MHWGIVVLAAFAVAVPPLPAAAKAIPADGGCELHVWPGSEPIDMYYGWVHGGTIDGSKKGREGYPPPPPNPLTPEGQAALLRESDLTTALGLPGYAITVHPVALDSRTIRTSKTRIADSQASCYAELIVDDLILNQNVISGSALRTSFRFRDFGDAAAPTRMFGSWTITELKLFPPKPGTDADAAVAEVKAAFKGNLGEFAAALTKPRKRK